MASSFKIPKKKHPTGSDSSDLHVQSPLSRLQDSSPQVKSYGDQSRRGGADRVHAGNSQRTPCKPLFRDVVKTLLELNSPNTSGSAAANHRSAGAWSRQSPLGRKSESSSGGFSHGWRPKRASDRLLQPGAASEDQSPPEKKRSDVNASSSRSFCVESVDSLAELRGEKHAGSLSLTPLGDRRWRRTVSKQDTDESDSSEPSLQQRNPFLSGSDQTSEDDESPSGTSNKPSADKTPPCRPSSSSSSSSVRLVLTHRTPPEHRRALDRTSWLAVGDERTEDVREKERRRWKEFREKKVSNRSAVLRLRLNKPRQTPAEPIVLSSEEEEGEDDARTTHSCSSRLDVSRPADSERTQAPQAARQTPPCRDEGDAEKPPPSFLYLDFTALHAGLIHVDANGKMAISDCGISIPLKGVDDGEVSVVASQVRGYGLWDGGVAHGGSVLDGWTGPAPSLLFLWVSDAQAHLLHKELSTIQTPTSTPASGPPCSFLLLVLKEQLQELESALLASILDMEEYQKGCASCTGPTSPLDWTDGLLLLHSCPPPLDQHLLRLLGPSAKSSPVRSSQRRTSLSGTGQQQLSSRLIQYPAPPCKGRITVTKEDLTCLRSGEFLNDVIIDFYLKFLLLEGVGGCVAERSHVFSSFFYKQLSRRRAAGEDDAPSVPDRHVRHQRVKTWTRHVDIFTKDFLFVPVNQEAHWFLVLVCFPGLEDVQFQDFQRQTGESQRAAVKTSSFSVSSQQQPDVTQRGCQRDTVLKRPCILVMDSLKLSYHENVCRLLRDYLQVEWDVRRGTPRLFSSDNMKSFNCRVPLQDNSSDCGLYLLQYAESFLQNPVVHFEFPLRLDSWFPRQRVRQKREEIRSLIMKMHHSQRRDEEN